MARIRRKPYDPNAKAHDRRSTDLLRNAQVCPIEVDDPYSHGEKIVVMRSNRNDPLARLHDRRQIDDAQYLGGRAFQLDFEAAERGPCAIDPSKEAVDGGLAPEPITEAQRKAGIRLSHAHRVLGQDGSGLIHDVLIHSLSMAVVAGRRGLVGKRWEEYFGLRFRECLDCLAKFYGFANDSSGKRRIVGEDPLPVGGT
jgi:hypothetical protein